MISSEQLDLLRRAEGGLVLAEPIDRYLAVTMPPNMLTTWVNPDGTKGAATTLEGLHVAGLYDAVRVVPHVEA